jgi:DNA-binding NtrC family response regulator
MQQGVLFISPDALDARALTQMLNPIRVPLDHAPSLQQARQRLSAGTYSVVLTETRLPDGTWTDVLDLAQQMSLPSAVIVTDRLADDRLWAEVLNLGAYDFLAQPFNACEVQRIVSNACYGAPRLPIERALTSPQRVARAGAS